MQEKKVKPRYKISENKRRLSKTTNLKLILETKRMSQKKLAELSDLETYQISNIVNGKAPNIYLTTAKKICNALNCSLDEAFEDIY
jgi:DNA-binding Xre family transcriptional regulator